MENFPKNDTISFFIMTGKTKTLLWIYTAQSVAFIMEKSDPLPGQRGADSAVVDLRNLEGLPASPPPRPGQIQGFELAHLNIFPI